MVDDASDEPGDGRWKSCTLSSSCASCGTRSNGGAAAARNTGLAEASSKWVSFLDSDDAWPADSLALRLEASGAPSIGLARSPDHPLAADGSTAIRRAGCCACAIRGPSRSVADFASGCWFSPGSCVIVDRAAVLQAVPGGQDASLRRLEDYDWCLALAMAGFRFEAAPVIGARIELKPSKSSDRHPARR